MLGDLVDAAHNLTVKGVARKLELHAVAISPIDDLRCAYYLSLFVADRPGVLSAISGVLGRHNVSVRSMEQDAPEPETTIPGATAGSPGTNGRPGKRTWCSSPTRPSSVTCRPACTSYAISTPSGVSAGWSE